MGSVLSEAYFHDEAAAFAALEAIVWPEGPACPHCGALDRINRLEGVKDKKGRVRLGLWKCYHCRGQFRCTKGTVFESSHLKLHQWFQAAYLLCSSKKGVSSHQLARTLRCTVKTAWFASHRIREAMRAGGLAIPFGNDGSAVEADETFLGRIKGSPKKPRGGYQHKHAILSLVDRKTKQVRSFHIDEATAADVAPVVRKNLSREAHLMTDQARYYRAVGREMARHETVDHSADEYVRYVKDPETGESYTIHTNTLEGYFSLFKRGMKGIYQHCSEKHLHRYLAEFDFRYNARVALGIDDMARTMKVLLGARGKRLTYMDSSA
jgi:transposase-like protein